MWLRQIHLERFRNLISISADLSPGFNFFHGLNGAGKTAILEAVHVLGRGRSFRSQQLLDLVQTGTDGFVIRAVAEDEHIGTQRLVFGRSRAGATELRINGEPGRRMSQLASLLPMEVMTPAMVELVYGGPGSRRQWLDWGVFHVKHDYLGLLRRYTAAVRQRNACLRGIAFGKLKLADLEVWTVEVARLGECVSLERLEHLEGIRQGISDCLRSLSADLDIELQYRRGWPDGVSFRNLLSENLAREVKSGATTVGPHRADIEFRIHGQLCATTLSRGQAKVLASALMLAQADCVRRSGRRAGVFLIDDIGAELDDRHRRHLFEALVERDSQVLATSVDPPPREILDRCPGHARFHVEQGHLVSV